MNRTDKRYFSIRIPSFPCSRSPRVGGPLSQSLAMIPPTMHGHEFNQPLSRVVMVRKTDQRTFSKGRRGGEPLLETVTRETVELFNGGRAERKYTSETRDIVTPKSNRYVYVCMFIFSWLLGLKGKNTEKENLKTFWKCKWSGAFDMCTQKETFRFLWHLTGKKKLRKLVGLVIKFIDGG